MDAKTDLFDEDTRPNLGYQLLVADHFTSVLDKDEQDIECTAAKFDRLVPFLQNELRGTQSKRPEGDNLLGVLAACLKHRLQGLNLRRRGLATRYLSPPPGRDPFSPSKLPGLGRSSWLLVLLTQTEMPTGRKICVQ